MKPGFRYWVSIQYSVLSFRLCNSEGWNYDNSMQCTVWTRPAFSELFLINICWFQISSNIVLLSLFLFLLFLFLLLLLVFIVIVVVIIVLVLVRVIVIGIFIVLVLFLVIVIVIYCNFFCLRDVYSGLL